MKNIITMIRHRFAPLIPCAPLRGRFQPRHRDFNRVLSRLPVFGEGRAPPLRSNWWFLLPIFLSIIGGIVAYFVLRNDDPPKAKNCLYLGIALTAVSIVLNLALGAYIEGVMAGLDYGVSA